MYMQRLASIHEAGR